MGSAFARVCAVDSLSREILRPGAPVSQMTSLPEIKTRPRVFGKGTSNLRRWGQGEEGGRT